MPRVGRQPRSGTQQGLSLTTPASTGAFESCDSGHLAVHDYPPNVGRIYGTYTTPGRRTMSRATMFPTSASRCNPAVKAHARIDASVPLRNSPELLATYWRTDFDRNPTTTNANGDTSPTGPSPAAAPSIRRSSSTASGRNGALETRPLADFTTTTTVEVRCRNTSVGGNGAVAASTPTVKGGLYAPLLVYLQRQSDGTQTLTLNGKTSDAVTKQLFTRSSLPERFRPLSSSRSCRKQCRESANQRRGPGHVHVSDLRADVDGRPLPDAIRRHQRRGIRLRRCSRRGN